MINIDFNINFVLLVLIGSNVEELEDISAEDVSAEESLLYDYEELVVATDNFSSRNKLGQGGFGAVYKVTMVFLYK